MTYKEFPLLITAKDVSSITGLAIRTLETSNRGFYRLPRPVWERKGRVRYALPETMLVAQGWPNSIYYGCTDEELRRAEQFWALKIARRFDASRGAEFRSPSPLTPSGKDCES